MKKSLNLFFQSLHEIQLFLKLTESPSGELNEKIILRSIIVLMVAAWEQFIEQLAEKSVLSLTNHLRDSNPIPEKVKQSIAIFTVPENRSNLRGFSNSVWNFSEKGWKKAYHDYCIFNSKELNTASSKNIKRFFENIIGIKDITSNWKYNNLTSVECANKLDDLIDLRHDIAHGANIRQNELNIKNTTFYNNFLREISSLTFDQTFNAKNGARRTLKRTMAHS